MEQQKNAELTVRENRLVQGIAEGLPVTEAARRAGYSEHSATSHVYHILKRPRVQSFLTEALERAGITPEQIVAPYVQGATCHPRAQGSRDPRDHSEPGAGCEDANGGRRSPCPAVWAGAHGGGDAASPASRPHGQHYGQGAQAATGSGRLTPTVGRRTSL